MTGPIDLDAILARVNAETLHLLDATTDVESRLVDVYRREHTTNDVCRFCDEGIEATGRRSVDYARHMIACTSAPAHLVEAMSEYLDSRR